MSKNIDQIYTANPITTNTGTDLMYFGQSPYGSGNDAAMVYYDFANQLIVSGSLNALGYYAAAGNQISPITTVANGVLITGNSGVPSYLSNGTDGQILTATSGSNPTWQDNISFSLTPYTPTVGDGSNFFTLSTAIGSYMNIGPITIVFIHVVWTGLGGATGAIDISLPFSSSTTPDRPCMTLGYMSGFTLASGEWLTGGIDAGTAFAKFFVNNNTGFQSVLAASQCNTNGEFQFQGLFGN